MLMGIDTTISGLVIFKMSSLPSSSADGLVAWAHAVKLQSKANFSR
jgi:predicted translin family RNA/ssDNA-binding protein